MRLRRVVRASLERGTAFDPKIAPYLDKDMRAAIQGLQKEEVLQKPKDHEPSVLVSLSPHAIHYLDLRILVIMRNLHAAGVKTTLVLRDHKASLHPRQRSPFPDAKRSLLEVLELLGVPRQDLTIVNWTDLAARMSTSEDYYRYLFAVDPAVGGDVGAGMAPWRPDLGDIITTLGDVFIASHPKYHPSTWMLGGPSRLRMQRLGIAAYASTSDAPPTKTIPLPRLPKLSSLPGILPDEAATRAAVLEDCKSLSKENLLMMHIASFELLEEALDLQLPNRPQDVETLAKMTHAQLASVTAAALDESISALRQRSPKRHPEDMHEVPPTRIPIALEALGDARRLGIMKALLARPEGLKANQILGVAGLDPSELTTLRRDLAHLIQAELVIATGIKPKTYRAAAKAISIRIG